MIKRSEIDRTLILAAVCSAAIIGPYLGLRAVRDALFQNWDIKTYYPIIKMATALVSLGVALAMPRLLRRFPIAWLLPRAFLASAALLGVVWALTLRHYDGAAGIAVYFHMALFGLVLISGFWTMVNARYDPRAAKRIIGLISAGGTVGGISGGLLVAQVKSPVILIPIFAALQVATAKLILYLKAPPRVEAPRAGAKDSGLALLLRRPYLRMVGLLLVCASMSGFFLDYTLQNFVQARYASNAARFHFFGLYTSIVPAVTLLLQVLATRFVLERLGLAVAAGLIPFAVVLTGSGAILWPTLLATVVVARGSEQTLRESFFKSAYEILFTPVPPQEKAPAKSAVDVGGSSMGDLAGSLAALVLSSLLTVQRGNLESVALLNRLSLSISVALSLVMLYLIWRLRTAYVRELEANLLNRTVTIDPAQPRDRTSYTVMLRTQVAAEPARAPRRTVADSLLEDITALRSGDPERIRAVLAQTDRLSQSLLPHVISALARDEVAREAADALQRVARDSTGLLVDVLLDPGQDETVRRRVARILGACGIQRAADGLLLALADPRFELRVHCGRALSAMSAGHAAIRLDPEAVYREVLREVESSSAVWEGQLALARSAGSDGGAVYDVVRDRANRALEHVFTLLALVLPREPVKIAYQGLKSGDDHLRGTVLEYLESILPAHVREKLWPFLEDIRRVPAAPRAPGEVVEEILGSHESLRIKVDQIRRAEAGRDSS